MSEWAVRNETAGTQTGFGSNADIASETFNALVERAKETGLGGTYALLKDGEVVSWALVPAREEPTEP